jgi:prepilin-type N-terminal cleavage/methylation domain-containing protein
MTTRLESRRRCACAPRKDRRAFTLVELLVVVLLFVLGSTFVVSCRRHHEGGSNRLKCASNLRQIGQAILLYADDNKGAYPRTLASPVKDGQEPLPTWGTGAPATHFLLLRTQDITAEVFVCPTDQDKDTYGGVNGAVAPIQRSNFTDHRKNLSYSYQNPYPRQKAIDAGFELNNAIGAEFAVAADKNPGMSGGDSFAKDNGMAPTATSPGNRTPSSA